MEEGSEPSCLDVGVGFHWEVWVFDDVADELVIDLVYVSCVLDDVVCLERPHINESCWCE